MKKIMFAMSIIAFVLATIGCFVYSPIVGVVVALVSAVLIWVNWYLVENDARWWSIIAIFILALILAFFAGTRIGKRCVDIRQAEVYEEVTEETTNSEEVLVVEDDNVQQNTKDTAIKEPVIVEKKVVVEKIVEVPVEKVVEKIVEVEVPKIEYVEVEKEIPTQVFDATTLMPVTPPSLESITSSTPNYNSVTYNGYYGEPTNSNYGSYNGYYGDPTNSNYGGYNGYYGDPTNSNYGGYNGYYGDPTNSNYGDYNDSDISIVIDGKKTKINGEKVTMVTAGETVTCTIEGTSKAKESKFYLPANVTVLGTSGNKAELYFEDGWTGACSIKYDSADIDVWITD